MWLVMENSSELILTAIIKLLIIEEKREEKYTGARLVKTGSQ